MNEHRTIINTNIRLNMSREDDKRAWQHLRNLDKNQYKSYTRAVVAAVNYYFDRLEALEDDPYLETRQKEDEFMKKILDTIKSGMKPLASFIGLIQIVDKESNISDIRAEYDEAANEAVDDFIEYSEEL